MNSVDQDRQRLAAEIDRRGIDLRKRLSWAVTLEIMQATGLSEMPFRSRLFELRRERGMRTKQPTRGLKPCPACGTRPGEVRR